MAVPSEVLTLAGRIATFHTAHQVPKRRASSSRKKTTGSTSWPHASPLPEDFARAGFYYRPTPDAPDNVQCFSCLRQLDGWEPHDDPILEHITHVPDCGWAINVCIGQRCATDPDNVAEEDPLSPRLVEARMKTFEAGPGWPHEDKKGWKCKVKKMVEAGWCYDPSPDADDGVTCFYCRLSLDGWEPKDDPLEEHRKRSLDCPFFSLLEQYAESRKQPPRKKARNSRTSKVSSRLSVQSDGFSEAPSRASIADITTQLDDSMISNATTTSTTGKRKGNSKTKGATKAPKKTTRRKKGDTMEPEELASIEYPVLNPSTDVDIEFSNLGSSQLSAPPAKRSTRAKNNVGDFSTLSVSTTSKSSPKSRNTRTRGSRKKVEESMLSEDASQLHAELQAAIDVSLGSLVPDDESTPKAARGTKRTSDGKAKADISIAILEDKPQPKRQNGRSKKATQQEKGFGGPNTLPSNPSAPETDSELHSGPSRPSKPAPKTKRTKRTQGTTTAEPESVEAELEPEPEPEADTKMLDAFPTPPAQRRPTPPEIEDDPVPTRSTPQAATASPSPAPSTPTPIKSVDHGVSRIQNHASAPGIETVERLATPTPSSPQSSDAENAPPSSIPASSRPPLEQLNTHTGQIPLASTPTGSQSRRDGITTSIPWSSVDLETIFVPSPGSKPGLSPLSALNKENFDFDTIDKATLKDVVKRVKDVMSEKERGMTVSEWILWNATRGEDKLRAECERLVSVFETQGVRALGVLEGIEVEAQ